MRNLFALILLSIVLQGCLGDKNAINKDVVFLQTVPVCTTDELCEKMWLAAQEWVEQYSPQGLEVVTDDVIQSETKELGSDEMDIEIKKIKQKNGDYKILINNICSRALSSCDRERKNMILFNKKLIAYMPAKTQKLKQQLFKVNKKIDGWIAHYVDAINKAEPEMLSQLVHFPVTYIEKDKIAVILSVKEMSQYLKTLNNKIADLQGEYVKADSIDVFAHNGRNLYVNAVFNVYDADSAIVAAQQLGFHLIEVDQHWKMISAGVHTD
ncbi:MAG: hypothetical protein OEY11_06085 [Gammaproteobacteria bacterium]|nr:hypothetical protein [Gammaproteobacteria bacterium]